MNGLTLSCIMIKNDQTCLKNLVVECLIMKDFIKTRKMFDNFYHFE